MFWQNVEKLLLTLPYTRISVCLPVRLPACTSAWNNSAPNERIFMKFDVWRFFKNFKRKFKFHWNPTRITDTLHEDLHTFMIISRSFLLRIKNVSDRICRQNQSTHFVFYNIPPPPPESRVVYEIMWKNIVELDRPEMTIQYGACELHPRELRLHKLTRNM